MSEQVEQHALALVEQVGSLTVQNDSEYEYAAGFLRDTVKAMLHEIDETFGPIIEQAHKAHKMAIAQRKKVETPVLEAEAKLKDMLGAFIQTRNQEALTVPKVEGVSTRETWKFRITDESAIQRQFLSPDVVKIGGIVRATHEAAEAIVGGIEVYSEIGVSSR